MSTDSKFTPRSLTASEYVRELFGPEDNAAILVRNRSTGHTVQTIAKAETIASPEFQTWLASQNASGSDVFMGMNPIKDGAYSRTKEDIKDIRHVYLDLDRKGDEALQAIRNSTEVPAPNFVLDTSPGKHQVVWKVSGFSQDEAESLLHSLANQVRRRSGGNRFDARAALAGIRQPTNFPRNSSSKRARKAMRSTRSAISRLTKIRPKHPDTLATTNNDDGRCRATTKANPNTIGPTRNAPSPAATTPKSSSSASPTIARTIKPIPNTTLATPSTKAQAALDTTATPRPNEEESNTERSKAMPEH